MKSDVKTKSKRKVSVKKDALVFTDMSEFGRSLGLTDLDMQLIRQKKRMIEKLKQARQKRGLSQADVAKLVACQQPAIARMESGQVSEVSMDFLARVALALEVSLTIRPMGKAA